MEKTKVEDIAVYRQKKDLGNGIAEDRKIEDLLDAANITAEKTNMTDVSNNFNVTAELRDSLGDIAGFDPKTGEPLNEKQIEDVPKYYNPYGYM